MNMKQKTFIDIISKEYSDKDNVFPKPMSDKEFKEIISNYILGDDWYTVNPVSEEQVNTYRAVAIIEKIKIRK